jgi:negative regulator of replication initiation
MRLTVNLDDDLYSMVYAHSIASRLSISCSINELLRRKLPHQGSSQQSVSAQKQVSKRTGLRVSRGRSGLSEKDIQRTIQVENIHYLDIARKK